MSSEGAKMDSVRVTVDVNKINSLFNELNLNNKDRKKSIKSALRKSASIIRKQAQSNLVSSIPAARTAGVRKVKGEIKHFKPLKDEINIAVYSNASGARIDLLDKRKKYSRAFILKFFNAGTKDRTKGHDRGSINATNFFTNAVNSKKAEAENNLEQNIIDMINKIASKKK